LVKLQGGKKNRKEGKARLLERRIDRIRTFPQCQFETPGGRGRGPMRGMKQTQPNYLKLGKKKREMFGKRMPGWTGGGGQQKEEW